MKRIFLSAITLMTILSARSQSGNDSNYYSRKLKFEEANLVTSYYSQSGEHAGVTGGIGSQELMDIATSFDVKFAIYDKKNRKHTFDAEVGIDHYTSASSDKVDLQANSSASHADTRIYPSITWTLENTAKGSGLLLGVSASSEFDYKSTGFTAGFSKKTKNRNGELNVKAQVLLDKVSLVLPVELRNPPGREVDDYARVGRNTYTGSLSWGQIINQRLQVAIIADFVRQEGYLSMPFYRVYFNDGTMKNEHLPSQRTKLPIGLRANYFIGDNMVLRAFLRYYTDSWGLQSYTGSLEIPIKLNAFFSLIPFYRYYSQTAIDYFKPYRLHNANEVYYSSNYDLSRFSSHFFGGGFRWTPVKGLFGLRKMAGVELRYGHFTRSNQLAANSISMHLTFKK